MLEAEEKRLVEFGFTSKEIARVKTIKARPLELRRGKRGPTSAFRPLTRNTKEFNNHTKELFAEVFGEALAEKVFGPGPWGKAAIARQKRREAK